MRSSPDRTSSSSAFTCRSSCVVIGGGRAGEKASYGLTESLCKFGFVSGRMKTGTPPRIDGRTLDYAKMEEQLGDSSPSKFSFTSNSKPLKKQLSCHITYTNEITHEILLRMQGFHEINGLIPNGFQGGCGEDVLPLRTQVNEDEIGLPHNNTLLIIRVQANPNGDGVAKPILENITRLL